MYIKYLNGKDENDWGINMAVKDLFIYKLPEKEHDFSLTDSGQKVKKHEETYLSGRYKKDVALIREMMRFDKNRDSRVREFKSKGGEKCSVFFIDGMVDRTDLCDFVFKPIMLFDGKSKIGDFIKNSVPEGEMDFSNSIDEILTKLNYGSCVLLAEGMKDAVIIDMKGWEHRGIEEAKNEIVLRGPSDAFSEMINANTSLLRRLIKNRDFVIEEVEVGTLSHTSCAVCYLESVASDSMIEEAKMRLENISTDYVFSSAEVEQFIEDKSFLTIPQFLSTERPDRTARAICEGRCAILVDGSPYAIISPITVFELNEPADDRYLRFPYVAMIHFVRLFAYFFSLLISGLYIAVINFHQEIIPTDLLMSIISAREKVPFPAFLELLLMEISLEIVREAGNRVPGTISSPLSIVGALILGQAAVEAKIVSPIMIIIVSFSAIGSLATPNYYISLSARVLKFMYIFLGALGGFLGITAGMIMHLAVWSSVKSMGVPMLSPIAPVSKRAMLHTGFIPPIWKREYRPDFLNTKREKAQPDISEKWRKS